MNSEFIMVLFYNKPGNLLFRYFRFISFYFCNLWFFQQGLKVTVLKTCVSIISLFCNFEQGVDQGYL